MVKCPKCGRDVRLRNDRKLPKHKIDVPRARRRGVPLDPCPASETLISDWVRLARIEKIEKRVRNVKSQESAFFEHIFRQCQYAYKKRHADAFTRTLALRDKYLKTAKNESLADNRRRIADYRQRKLSQLIYQFRHAILHRTGVTTPERALKPHRTGAVARLYEAGHLGAHNNDTGCLRAAVEIAKVCEAVSGFMWSRSRAMDAPRGAGGAGKYGVDKMPDWLADLHGSTYAPWCRDMSERSDVLLSLILAVVVFDDALGLARRRYGIGYKKALTMLEIALGEYAIRMRRRIHG